MPMTTKYCFIYVINLYYLIDFDPKKTYTTWYFATKIAIKANSQAVKIVHIVDGSTGHGFDTFCLSRFNKKHLEKIGEFEAWSN
jgi:hypothetical protein